MSSFPWGKGQAPSYLFFRGPCLYSLASVMCYRVPFADRGQPILTLEHFIPVSHTIPLIDFIIVAIFDLKLYINYIQLGCFDAFGWLPFLITTLT